MNPIQIQLPRETTMPTPVRVPVDATDLPAGDFGLQPEGQSVVMLAQRDGDAIVVMASGLPAGQALSCTVVPSSGAGAGVTVTEGPDKLTLSLPQGQFGAYHFGPEVVRPFFWPLHGPGQIPVTREANMDGDAGRDHKHHRSLFSAYEEANGACNWHEEEGHGFTRHQGFSTIEQGPVFGGFTAQGLWTNKHVEPVLTETRRLRLYNTGSEARLLDYDITLSATHGDVTFGETKEAGILGIRVNPSMNGADGGTITNSEGGTGEAECWGHKAAWCDYSGEVNGQTVGITVFDHPSNPNHPTRWHVRNYGLFATNPFSTASFEQGAPTPFVLPANQNLAFRYRILLHQGAGVPSELQNLFQDFANTQPASARAGTRGGTQ